MVTYFASSVLYTTTVYFFLLLWLVHSFTQFWICVHQQQIIHFHSAGYQYSLDTAENKAA